jgi:hypothetical protein
VTRPALAVGLLLLLAAARPAAAEAARPDPPRWRLRAALSAGVGGSWEQGEGLTVFPVSLELGARLYGPLSLTVLGTGVLMGAAHEACGALKRANAALGAVGLRVDFANRKSASWVSPFIEAHAGVGGQQSWGADVGGGECPASPVFATGGARVGLDAWLGRVAVTVAAAFDWLPAAPPISVSLGATILLY